jgi:hypothetical protein
MADRVSFSNAEQSLEEITAWRSDVQAGLAEFFSGDSSTLLTRYEEEEIEAAFESALAELDLTTSLSVLSSIEAAIRLDYLQRVYGRWRDPLSKAMNALHQDKANYARLEEDLIRLWRDRTGVRKVLLAELVSAFRYRHWLAHGRYWTPKFGRRYSYDSVFEIAREFSDEMQKHGEASKEQ